MDLLSIAMVHAVTLAVWYCTVLKDRRQGLNTAHQWPGLRTPVFFCHPWMFWSLKFSARVLDVLCHVSCSLPPHHGDTSYLLLLLVISLCNSLRLAYYSDSISTSTFVTTQQDLIKVTYPNNKIRFIFSGFNTNLNIVYNIYY